MWPRAAIFQTSDRALVERGFIRRLQHRARALEIIRLPEDMSHGGPPAGPFKPSVIEGSLGQSANLTLEESDTSEEVPVLGRIAAGTPIEAIQHATRILDVPKYMLTSGGEFYALEVVGDSMIDEGILEGDTVVLERTDTATTGDIVVALIDREEATLKKFRKRGNTIALEPANQNYETRIFGPDRVHVQGRLVALFRQY